MKKDETELGNSNSVQALEKVSSRENIKTRMLFRQPSLQKLAVG